MRLLRLLTVFSGVVCLASTLACSNDDSTAIAIDFRQSSHGWAGDFADYPIGEDAFYELEADYRALPDPLSSSGGGQECELVFRSFSATRKRERS